MADEPFIEWLEKNIVRAPLIFGDPNPIDRATRASSAQTRRWESIFQMLGDSNVANQLRQRVFQHLRNHQPQVKEMPDGTASLDYALPLIKEDPPATPLGTEQVLLAASALNRTMALMAPQYVDEAVRIVALAEVRFQKSLQDLSAFFTTQLETISPPNDAQTKSEKLLQQLSKEATHWRKEAAVTLQQLGMSVTEAARAADLVRKQVAETSDSAIQSIAGLRDAQKELVKIAPAVELWKAKARGHSIGFFVGAGLFATGLAGTTVLAILYGSIYAKTIVESIAGHDLLGTALIAAPFLAAAWVLRLISRFTLMNLTLWQDAHQRTAVARFYLGLLSEERPAISENERALALAALFRPTPGSETDDVSPPSFLDLIRGKTNE